MKVKNITSFKNTTDTIIKGKGKEKTRDEVIKEVANQPTLESAGKNQEEFNKDENNKMEENNINDEEKTTCSSNRRIEAGSVNEGEDQVPSKSEDQTFQENTDVEQVEESAIYPEITYL